MGVLEDRPEGGKVLCIGGTILPTVNEDEVDSALQFLFTGVPGTFPRTYPAEFALRSACEVYGIPCDRKMHWTSEKIAFACDNMWLLSDNLQRELMGQCQIAAEEKIKDVLKKQKNQFFIARMNPFLKQPAATGWWTRILGEKTIPDISEANKLCRDLHILVKPIGVIQTETGLRLVTCDLEHTVQVEAAVIDETQFVLRVPETLPQKSTFNSVYVCTLPDTIVKSLLSYEAIQLYPYVTIPVREYSRRSEWLPAKKKQDVLKLNELTNDDNFGPTYIRKPKFKVDRFCGKYIRDGAGTRIMDWVSNKAYTVDPILLLKTETVGIYFKVTVQREDGTDGVSHARFDKFITYGEEPRTRTLPSAGTDVPGGMYLRSSMLLPLFDGEKSILDDASPRAIGNIVCGYNNGEHFDAESTALQYCAGTRMAVPCSFLGLVQLENVSDPVCNVLRAVCSTPHTEELRHRMVGTADGSLPVDFFLQAMWLSIPDSTVYSELCDRFGVRPLLFIGDGLRRNIAVFSQRDRIPVRVFGNGSLTWIKHVSDERVYCICFRLAAQEKPLNTTVEQQAREFASILPLQMRKVYASSGAYYVQRGTDKVEKLFTTTNNLFSCSEHVPVGEQMSHPMLVPLPSVSDVRFVFHCGRLVGEEFVLNGSVHGISTLHCIG